MNMKRLLYIVLGPVLFAICTFAFQNTLSLAGAEAIGVLIWMIFWWVTQPVNITVTAFVPIMANALFNIIPMESVTSRYFSDSIILIFGSCLLTIPWKSTGLDRRIALKVLSIVGPTIKSQIIVWLLASMLFSTVLPNIAVVALFCPIAVAMLNAAGYDDISKSAPAVPILLCIGWGLSLIHILGQVNQGVYKKKEKNYIMKRDGIDPARFFSEMSEYQITAQEFFSSVLLDSLNRNFGLKKAVISYFDTEGQFLSWTSWKGIMMDCEDHPYRKIAALDVVRNLIYREAVRARRKP